MYLEKLEIQGFKSFANKNVLVFPGMLDKERRGITAIVGPNGSGKSNIADAIRWALGEQSMKTLRGKKSEDIIFSGSDKKGRLGMAEVSLFLNNQDQQAPIDYSQIVLTRRLYRDGESEYLLNNSRVRLADIQILLAKSNFGQKTYSVIGQGMVEGFLNTTLAERKEFFDEATGVKQFQIKRDDSLSKLVSSYDNLNQANMLLEEIEPRLKSLTRQVNRLKKRSEIEKELKGFQLEYYSKIWHQNNDKFNEFNRKFLEMEKIKLDKEKKIGNLNKELGQLEKQSGDNVEFEAGQRELNGWQAEKDINTKQMAKLEAQLELRLEAQGQFDLSWLNNKKSEIEKEIIVINEEVLMLEKNIGHEKNRLGEMAEEKNKIDEKINKINSDLIEQSSALSGKETKEINLELKKLVRRLELAEQENSLANIKILIKKIKEDIDELATLADSTSVKENLEKVRQSLMELTQAKEEIAVRFNESNFRISARGERVKLLKETRKKIDNELAAIVDKLGSNDKKTDRQTNNHELQNLKNKQLEIDQGIKNIKEKINALNAKEGEKKAQIFNLQKNLQNLQNETNRLSYEISELKINSTRFETKLEDLEIEIRNNYGNLKEIREHRSAAEINLELALEKINSLKRQIEQIGGIDPEIEKEYLETKERYDYLSDQVKDLFDAIASLEKIIKELDLIIKNKFDSAFKNITNKFEEYFKILFNGGSSKIIKVLVEETEAAGGEQTEQTEKLETEEKVISGKSDRRVIDLKKIKFLQKYNATGLAGIEIQATPPGKKIKSIAMLSGGERALTAIALICAIISCNPSPFVVLDEVDAALDEANSERLAKILDDLSHKTQFIVVTHNRASMRRANILYGVTMQNDGVSKLLSIKLDQAKSE